MYNVANVIQVKKGFADQVVEKFEKRGEVLGFAGFLGIEVMVTEQNKDYEDVTILTRWDSKENFTNWVKSDVFKKVHTKENISPDFILGNKVVKYEVKLSKQPESIVN